MSFATLEEAFAPSWGQELKRMASSSALPMDPAASLPKQQTAPVPNMEYLNIDPRKESVMNHETCLGHILRCKECLRTILEWENVFTENVERPMAVHPRPYYSKTRVYPNENNGVREFFSNISQNGGGCRDMFNIILFVLGAILLILLLEIVFRVGRK